MKQSTIIVLIIIALVIAAYIFLIHKETKKPNNPSEDPAWNGPVYPQWYMDMLMNNPDNNIT